MVGQAVNRWTMIPLPMQTACQDASKANPDIKMTMEALLEKTTPPIDRFHDPVFFKNLRRGRFETEDGNLFPYEESLQTKVRQLCLGVVPKALRQLVFNACHTSLFGDHMGIMKTYWRIMVHFWWPGTPY